MISVIVPVYNAARFLTPTVQSVLGQTYADWELLLVNDGSTDGTDALAHTFAAQDSRVRALAQANAGCAAARNHGFAHINPASEYVIFLDHDDIWEPDALDTLLQTARARPNAVAAVAKANVMQPDQADAVQQAIQRKIEDLKTDTQEKERRQNASGAAASTIDQTPPNGGIETVPDTDALTFDGLLSYCPIWTMGQVLIRCEAFTQAGRLDVHCAPSDDWDLYLRLALCGAFVTTPKTGIHWRSHDYNTSKNKPLMQQAEARVRAKLLDNPGLSARQRQMVVISIQNPTRYLSMLQLQWARQNVGRHRYGEALRQTRRAVGNYVRSLRSAPTSTT